MNTTTPIEITATDQIETFDNLVAIDAPRTKIREDGHAFLSDDTMVLGFSGRKRHFHVRPFSSGDHITDRFRDMDRTDGRILTSDGLVEGIAVVIQDLGDMVRVQIMPSLLGLQSKRVDKDVSLQDPFIEQTRSMLLRIFPALSELHWHPGKFKQMATHIGGRYGERLESVSDVVGAVNMLYNGIVGSFFTQEGVPATYQQALFYPDVRLKRIQNLLKERAERTLLVGEFHRVRDKSVPRLSERTRGMMPLGIHSYVPASCPVKDPEGWLMNEQLTRFLLGEKLMIDSSELAASICRQIEGLGHRKKRGQNVVAGKRRWDLKGGDRRRHVGR